MAPETAAISGGGDSGRSGGHRIWGEVLGSNDRTTNRHSVGERGGDLGKGDKNGLPLINKVAPFSPFPSPSSGVLLIPGKKDGGRRKRGEKRTLFLDPVLLLSFVQRIPITEGGKPK